MVDADGAKIWLQYDTGTWIRVSELGRRCRLSSGPVARAQFRAAGGARFWGLKSSSFPSLCRCLYTIKRKLGTWVRKTCRLCVMRYAPQRPSRVRQ